MQLSSISTLVSLSDRPAWPVVEARPGAEAPEQDRVEISAEARQMAAGQPAGKDGNVLSPEEQRQLEELKTRDREVRAHEQAHLAAGGSMVRGGARYQYETGPDGSRYAVGGEVSIDTSAVSDDPRATLRKAEQIRRTALAPATPSAQDRSVAVQAEQMAVESRRKIMEEAYRESGGPDFKVVKGKNGLVGRFV